MEYKLTSFCTVCGKMINSRIISKQAYESLVVLVDSKTWVKYGAVELLHYLPCIDCAMKN